jgi:hypothetical protein
MDTTLQRVVKDVIDRITGPLHFRILLQPTMAIFFGVRDGIRDAHENRPPYFWDIFVHPGHAKESLKSGFKAVARILILGLIMDAIYQFLALRWFYPGEAILVTLELVFVPYLLVRGPANRIARRWALRGASPLPRQGGSQ